MSGYTKPEEENRREEERFSASKRDEIYRQLLFACAKTDTPQPSRDEVEAYLSRPANSPQLSEGDLSMRQKIVDILKIDTVAANTLSGVMKNEVAESRRQMAEQRKLAQENKLLNFRKREAIKAAREAVKKIDLDDKKVQKAREDANAERPRYYNLDERNIAGGRGHYHLFHPLLTLTNLGSHASRHQDISYPNLETSAKITPLEHRSDDGLLRGASYTPDAPNGKVVICFTGTHSPGANQIAAMANNYLAEGTTVIHFDYRGFGKSQSLDSNGVPTGTKLSEDSLYKDSREMYKAVLAMGYKPEDVILHGYSMGGAVASKLAADIAEANHRIAEKTGQPTPREAKIGGVVLHSPIRSNYKAAKAEYEIPLINFLAGAMAKGTMGNFDTEAHMERLAKFEPETPVHLTCNHRGGDQLNIKTTGLGQALEGKFPNMTSYINPEPSSHESPLSMKDEAMKRIAKGEAMVDVPLKEPELNQTVL